MDSQVLMTLLITIVLLDVVEVITTDDDGALHLSNGTNGSGQDTSTNANLSGEWALVVDVGTLDGLTGSTETQTDLLVVTKTTTLGGSTGGKLVVQEDGLLLERLLRLHTQKWKILMEDSQKDAHKSTHMK